jgi:hypothetical protein
MGHRDRKRERARLIEARTEQDRARFRAAMPFGREQMVELLADLSGREPAADPFGNTKEWLTQHGFPVEPVLEALAARDLSSDWDVLLAANPFDLYGPTPRRLAWMPLERDQLEALMTHLDEIGEAGQGCDGSARHTGEWLSQNRLPVRETLAALMALGGGCDCEMANVEPEWIYPPGLSLVPAPPPPRPRPAAAAAKPTELRDEALVFRLPGKPWYQRKPPAGAALALQFGKGFQKPELLVLAGLARPQDEAAWCRQRWHQVHLDRWTFVRGETRKDAENDLRQRWVEQGREIVGPEPVEPPHLSGRWYTSKGKGHPVDAAWCLLELPRGFRVVELVVGSGTWDPFGREAKKLLASIDPT